ncbi:MAG: ATP-binding cassette domain-containing protein [bacterium]|nr:ATP-binding cassette domain-containing protein [bacterium]
MNDLIHDMTNDPILELRNLSVRTAASTIVYPADLSVRRYEPFTLLGETGCGKSLLMHAVMGVLSPELHVHGEVWLEGRDLLALSPVERRASWGRQLALLPQEPWLSLDPLMRVDRQVQEGLDIHMQEQGSGRNGARRLLSALGLGGYERAFPFQLSGGMAQRVAFAAACAGGAEMVLADEPTKGLDADRLRDVVALLAHKVEEGAGLLTITHDIEVARLLSGRVAIMCEGKIVESGTVEDVLQRPQHPYTKRLVAAEPSHWPPSPPLPAKNGDKPIVCAQGMAVRRGDTTILKDQNFQIRRGEIVGVTGPSGCGKSTFGDALLGLLQADAGSIEQDQSYTPLRFQKIYQDPPATFPRHITLGRALDDLARLHHFSARHISLWMDRLRLPEDLLERLPAQVSGGELQRFALLRVLLLEPVFLFADEPTSRLDLITQQQVMEILVHMARERDCALLLVSHHTQMVSRVADRVHQLA